MGGSKVPDYPSPPPIVQQQDNTSEMMGLMQSMIQNVQASIAQGIGQPPGMPPMPQIFSAPSIDWKAALNDLNTDAMDEAFERGTTRKGRIDTVLSSPLLDDEAAQTTSLSTLGGSE